MGIFSKTRYGTINPTDGSGRHFCWTIPNFSSYAAGCTLDSENVVCFNKKKFHFHVSLGSKGDVGLYIHYKSPPIPKYSYYFENSKNEVLRQHTAHTIPSGTERCGHWNVCNHKDMMDFIGDTDTLTIRFSFDDDTVAVKRLTEQNMVSVLWTIPNLFSQNLSPFSSQGFVVDNTLAVIRIDNMRANAGAPMRFPMDDVTTLIFFLFARKGNIPPHSIELLDTKGNVFAKVDRKEDDAAQRLLVPKDLVAQHLDPSGTLFVKINLFAGGNPLAALNLLSEKATTHTEETPKTVEIGENKQPYALMDD